MEMFVQGSLVHCVCNQHWLGHTNITLKPMTLTDILRYEIHASWWAGWFSNPTLQDFIGSYFAWKVGRKYRRYLKSMEILERLIRKGRV